MIDWGDDSPITTGSSDIQGMNTIVGAHQYFLPGFYTIIVMVIDKDGGIGTDTLQVNIESVIVGIDIKPSSDTNSINPDSKGVIPVAILTNGDFDATTVRGDTCRLGPGQAAPRHYAVEDVDRDGDLDMILHFPTQETGLTFSDTEATLTGQTTDDRYIIGTDVVRIVPPKGKTEPGGKDDAPGQNKEPGDNNEAPSDISLSNDTIDENVSVGTSVGTFTTTDPDTGDTHTYSLVSGTGDTDNSSFTIGGAGGDELLMNASIDYETQSSYNIRVETSDGNLAWEEIFTITVNDLADSKVKGKDDAPGQNK
jgi:hypothetical protein